MSTSSYLQFYTGYYAGGTPVVMSANPYDVAQDLSTGNLWQYTGTAWVAPSWNSTITFYLGAATTVCERLTAEDTQIPVTIQAYIGTAPQVPADLALSENDLAIKHDIDNYTITASIYRQDVTTNTVVVVPFPEGSIVTTANGDWTIFKDFNTYVGFDGCTVALTWLSAGEGPQVVTYITSAEAQAIVDNTISSGGFVTSDVVQGLVDDAVSSGGFVKSGAVVDIAEGIVDYTLAEGGYVDSAYVDSAIASIPAISGVLTSGSAIHTTVGNAMFVVDNDDITLSISDDGLGSSWITQSTQVLQLHADGTLLLEGGDVDIQGELSYKGNAVATQPWVEDYVSSHGGSGGGVDSGTVIELAHDVVDPVSGGLQSQITVLSGSVAALPTVASVSQIVDTAVSSGALLKDSAWTTTVGGYTMSFDGNGGLSITSGSDDGHAASVTLTSYGVELGYRDGELGYANDYRLSIKAGGVEVGFDDTIHTGEYFELLHLDDSGITANGSAITQTTSEFSGTSLGIGTLAGGVKYVCQSALTDIVIGSIASGCNAEIRFSVATSTPNLDFPVGIAYVGVTPDDPTSHYIMVINDSTVVCNPYTIYNVGA